MTLELLVRIIHISSSLVPILGGVVIGFILAMAQARATAAASDPRDPAPTHR